MPPSQSISSRKIFGNTAVEKRSISWSPTVKTPRSSAASRQTPRKNCTIGGVYNGFHDLYELGFIDRIPKILGVQSTGCCPFVDAAREGRDLIPAEENTIADSIAVGVPRNPKKALRAVSASNGTWIAVSDEQILDAMRVLGRTEGVFGEPAGVTATAGVRQAVADGVIKPNETVTVISTGSGLKDVKNALRAAGKPTMCEPSLEALEKSGIL